MSKIKAFIVEDDPIFSKLLEHELTQGKLTPYETYLSGEACLENLHHGPKLVLLDFSLGGLNGLDVLLLIKEKSPRIDVVMLTGVDDEMVKQKCMEAGATNYIIKNPDGIYQLRNEILPKYINGGLFSFLK